MTHHAGRTALPVRGTRAVERDDAFERGLSEYLRQRCDRQGLVELYGRYVQGEGEFDALMRRTALRSLARAFGDGVTIERGVMFRHPETFEIGGGVSIGEHVVIQGRIGGTCRICNDVWIGPHADIGIDVVILPGVRVGRGAIVGEGAVVTTDVEAFAVVPGVPARLIGRQ
jgi:acetyltransferase-like isoleucine patch superfamily enzyme